jgi:hypothetical protein
LKERLGNHSFGQAGPPARRRPFAVAIASGFRHIPAAEAGSPVLRHAALPPLDDILAGGAKPSSV